MTHRKLLLVEDDPQDERLTLRALGSVQQAQHVDVVRDGAAALDYLFRRNAFSGLDGQPLPAVVLLDIKLPKLSGLEVLERLRGGSGTRTLPVVMLSSSDARRDIQQSYQLGANSYVRKPVDARAFVHTIAELGIYWLGINEPAG